MWLLSVYSAGDGVTYPTRTIDLDSDGLLADRQRWMEEGESDGGGEEQILFFVYLPLAVFLLAGVKFGKFTGNSTTKDIFLQ